MYIYIYMAYIHIFARHIYIYIYICAVYIYYIYIYRHACGIYNGLPDIIYPPNLPVCRTSRWQRLSNIGSFSEHLIAKQIELETFRAILWSLRTWFPIRNSQIGASSSPPARFGAIRCSHLQFWKSEFAHPAQKHSENQTFFHSVGTASFGTDQTCGASSMRFRLGTSMQPDFTFVLHLIFRALVQGARVDVSFFNTVSHIYNIYIYI